MFSCLSIAIVQERRAAKTNREIHTHKCSYNEFFAKRKVLADKNPLEDPVLKSFLVGKKLYICESLVTAILLFVYFLT